MSLGKLILSRRLVLASVFLLFGISTPAFSIVPLVFGYGLVASAETAFNTSLLLSTATIGGAILGFNFAPSEAPSMPRLSVRINPAAELPNRPAGWTAPITGVQPQPPSSVQPSVITGFMPDWATLGANPCLATVADACISYYGYSNCSATMKSCGLGTTCPSGYSVNGSSCTLSNAAQVMKPSDGHCTIMRTANSFSGDPQDPDCVLGSGVTISADGTQVTVTGSAGESATVKLNPDGSATGQSAKPNAAKDKTEYQTVTASPPSASGDSQITGTGINVVPGTGTQAGQGNTIVEFDKSGLATEGTQGAIKGVLDEIKTGINGLGGDVGEGVQGPNNEGWQSGLTSGENGSLYNTLKTELKEGWGFSSILPAVGTCTPITGSVMGAPVSINLCPAVETLRMLIGWLLYLSTLWAVFRIFTTAPAH